MYVSYVCNMLIVFCENVRVIVGHLQYWFMMNYDSSCGFLLGQVVICIF